MEHEQVKELVLKIARSLVDHIEEVSVHEIESRNLIIIELTVAKSDMGKILGKHGQNVEAIRTILSAASRKNLRRYMLEIIE